MKIGLFDSGIGGLNVLNRLMKELPEHQYIYIGDKEHFPYGDRRKFQITRLSHQNTKTLVDAGAEMVVVACNTATAIALKKLQYLFDIPIIGMIEAGAQAAVRATNNNKIAVMGTTRLVESTAYTKEIKRIKPEIEVLEIACPTLANIIDEGYTEGRLLSNTIDKYLEPLRTFEPDTLILGCTHYSAIKKIIIEVCYSHYPSLYSAIKKIIIIDPINYISKYVKEVIESRKDRQLELFKKLNRSRLA